MSQGSGAAGVPPTLIELFDLMRAAPERGRSLRMSYRRWTDPRTVALAVGEGGVLDRDVGVDPPIEVVGQVWIDGDSRVRSVIGDSVSVVAGERWFARSPAQFISSDTHPGELGIERLDDARYPFTFIPELEFGHVSRSEAAGRPCCVVPAWQKDRFATRRHPRVAAGDEWWFTIDGTTGLALRIESFWRRAPATLLEILDLEVEPRLDETLFRIEGSPEHPPG